MIPVVALPGLLLGESSWHALAVLTRRISKRGFTAHSFPGFDGRRRFPHETPSPSDYANDLLKRFNVFETKRAHLIAHCSGCLPAIEFARQNPDRVASLTLVAYWYGAKEWESRQVIKQIGVDAYARERAPSLVRLPEHVSRVQGFIIDAVTDPDGMLAMARSIVAFYNKDVYDCPVPLHFVVGGEDTVTPPAPQVHVAMKAGGVLTTIPSAGHCAQIEEPAMVFGRCEPFWTAHDGAQ